MLWLLLLLLQWQCRRLCFEMRASQRGFAASDHMLPPPVQTAPSSTLKPIQLPSLASCTSALTLRERCMHSEERKRLRTTIKTSSRVEKCRGVEKQVSASGATSSAWVIDCPNQPHGSQRGHAWICFASRNGFVWSGKHISFQHFDYWSLAKKRQPIESSSAGGASFEGLS